MTIEEIINHLEDLQVFKHEPTNDDVIALSEAIEILQNHKYGKWKGYTRGRFVGTDDFGDPIYKDTVVYVCSICGRKTVIKENFCPKCGTNMQDRSNIMMEEI